MTGAALRVLMESKGDPRGIVAPAIRTESPADDEAIRAVHRAAFPTDFEARLVGRLRDAGRCRVSLVAELEGDVVGHVLFTPVSVEGTGVVVEGLGLAPLAVRPDRQRRGVGSALVREGLGACRARGCPFVVVLGEPAYYARFGFRRASAVGVGNEYGVDEAFQILELESGSLPASDARARYAPEFDG